MLCLPSASAVEPLEKSAPNGFYCKLCDQYHLVDHSTDYVLGKY